MDKKLSGIRAVDRATRWQSGPHRFCYWFCAGCLALYVAYAAYLSQSKLFVSSADTVASLLWFAVIVCGAFWLLTWFSGLRFGLWAPEARAKLNPRVMLVATAISLIILAVYLMADYPGGVSVDSAVQWTQASTGLYSNWHPVFHTLLIRLVWRLLPNYAFAIAVQCGVFSLALGYLIASLYAWGIRLWALLILEALAVASPILGHTMMYLWKDNAMTVGVVILAAQSVHIYFSRGSWLQKTKNALAFGAALAFTTLVRHNALLFTLPLLVTTLLCYRGQLRGMLTAGATLLVALALVWGPLYTAVGVTYPNNTTAEAIGVPMTILCNVRTQNPDALDAETRAFTDAMADESGWQTYQTDDYNSIKFGTAREVVSRAPLAQIVRMTVSTAKADPRRAFLAVDGVTDLVWGLANEGVANVTVRNSGDLPSVPKQDGTLNRLGAAAKALIAAPLDVDVLAWVYGNLGVTFLALLALSLRALRVNGTRVLALCLPTLLYNLGTMCVLCGTDARFFSFSPLLCSLSALVLLRDLPTQTLPIRKVVA